MPSIASQSTRASGARIFWATSWLVFALVAIKATYVKLSPFWAWATTKDYFSWLFIRWVSGAAHSDVLFAVSAGIIGALVLIVVRRYAQAERVLSISFLIFCAVSVFYAVLGRQVFSYYAAPLTYQLLALGGEPAKMWSSLAPFATPASVTSLIVAPAIYLIVVWITTWTDARTPGRVRRSTKALVAIALVGWIFLGSHFISKEGKWFEAQDRHLPDSPHATLLLSLFPGTKVSISGTRPSSDEVAELMTPPPPRLSTFGSVARPRNVILVVLESVGTEYLSLYGSNFNTTPRLAAEAKNAMVFNKYYAPVAWTAYSLLGLTMSEQPPMERYNTTTFRTGAIHGESLATVLQHAGYRTAFMAAGDPDWASAGSLEKNGFQEVVHGNQLEGAKNVSSWGTEDRFLFHSMLKWIDERRSQPFFLMVWTDQTHHPYTIGADQKLVQVLPRDKKNEDLGRYLSLIHESDAQIGALMDSLRSSKLADSTLVVITGDHGEAFGKLHGSSGHGFTVYDEEVRVPLMLWNPALFHGAARSDVIGSHPDLAPTVLDALGIAAPRGWDGHTLFDPAKPPRAYFFAAAWGEYLLGVRDNNLKYVYDAREGTQELFDLGKDPNEQRNIAAADTADSNRLRERLASWLYVERLRSASRK